MAPRRSNLIFDDFEALRLASLKLEIFHLIHQVKLESL